MTKVPFNDLKKHHEEHMQAFREIFDQVAGSCAFVGGPEVATFEKNFADFCGTRHCIGVGNGTDAITASLKALGIQPGDRVATVANTFIATTEGISMAGGEPVFVEVREDEGGMCPDDLQRVLETHPEKDRIRFVLPVHLFGQPADMPAIVEVAKKHELKIVADCAQSHGALIDGRPHAAYADANTYSFYPGKNLGALGDGGAIATDSEQVDAFVRSWANHGRGGKHEHKFEGMNSRLDGLQAAFLNRKLSVLAEKTRLRQHFSKQYIDLFAEVDEVQTPAWIESRLSVFHLFVVRVNDRDGLAEKLAERGIQSGIHYPVPLHLQPAYSRMNLKEGSLPVTEKLCSRILSLPLYPEMEDWMVPTVVEAVKEVV